MPQNNAEPQRGDRPPYIKETAMPQSFGALYFHLIFSTKNRIPLITPELQPRLYEFIGGTLSKRKCCLLAASGIADHIHLLASLSRESSVADTIRDIKSISSGWIHTEFPRSSDFAWQSGYAAYSVSYSNLDSVRIYLANQAEHHRIKSFQQEYIEFLTRHDMEYDERYIWD
jgi:putative transposase